MMENIPEVLTGERVVEIVKEIFDKLPIILACKLVDSNVVLTLAGLKAESEFFVDLNTDLKAINKLNKLTEEHLDFHIVDKISNNWMIRIVNLKGWERISKTTKIPGVNHFESKKGWNYFHNNWHQNLCKNIGKYVYGIKNSYPDTAIYDLVEWSNETQQRKLQEADIPYIGIYNEVRPTYSFFPEHEYIPDIQENIKQAENILKDFYESKWHKEIENKLAFHKYNAPNNYTK
jgi:hypothetical protein